MPIFEYVPDCGECETCDGKFEVLEKMDAKPLTICPTCEKPCHRVFSSFGVSGKGKSLLSSKNLSDHGFTQYKRKGKGYYEKSAGVGPNAIADDS